MQPENLKTQINVNFVGVDKAHYSFYDFNVFKNYLRVTIDNTKYSKTLTHLEIEGRNYKIADTQVEILPETTDLHLKYGVSFSEIGQPLPYNLRITFYVEK